jgi:A/G-specific adenine glycosylase
VSPIPFHSVSGTSGTNVLLLWYEARQGSYPWRRAPTPYRVLVSEFMLQQTQAARVVPLYRAFLRRFPTLRALAMAPRSEVIRAWAGLGYNRRAVALSEAARIIVARYGGRVPRHRDDLRRLPGVGPYTAAAVASMAYGQPVPALDVNVRRVVARARLGVDPERVSPRDLSAAAAVWIDPARPGAWNQAVMDLGREICRPRPRCHLCPLAPECGYKSRGQAPSRPSSPLRPYEGSSRQLRGQVVAILRLRPQATLRALSVATGRPPSQVTRVVASLAREGIVGAGRGALAGSPGGRIHLAP